MLHCRYQMRQRPQVFRGGLKKNKREERNGTVKMKRNPKGIFYPKRSRSGTEKRNAGEVTDLGGCASASI